MSWSGAGRLGEARGLRRAHQIDRADQGTIRRSNLSLVLNLLRDQGRLSRARISAETGLNKATVSSLVSDLVSRGLARDGAIAREGAIGRPSQLVEIDGRVVCGVGVEVNADYVSAVALDLRDEVILERRLPMDVAASGVEHSLDAAAKLVSEAIEAGEASGAITAGVTVTAPALVETTPGVLTFAPNLGWRHVPIADDLAARLGRPGFPIQVDNDANLGALGEYYDGAAAGTPDLVYLTGDVGVGSGVIAGGQLLRGAEGFSGEVGHMPLEPDGHLCSCGRRGCWETMVGLSALLRLATTPDDPLRDPSLDLEQRLAEIERRARGNDARTLDALLQIGSSLGLGASILVNVFNPRVLVLGGYFAQLGTYLLEPMMRELRARVVAPECGGCRVDLSTLGFTAASRGGAHVALEAVLADPTLVPTDAAGGLIGTGRKTGAAQ
jgi:predicted NBD/HSP70 family sugar kinase